MPAASRGWLWGSVPDLLLGCGVGYLVSIPLLLWAIPQNSWPILTVSALSLFISGPHYGATIMRVYQNRDDRRRYAAFAVWMTIGLVGLFALGLHNVLVGSLLLTLYLTWAPWHFAGQNYGVALMFLRRRGVPIPALAKRLLWLSFFLSFVLSFLALHAGGAPSQVPGHTAVYYAVLRLGLPAPFAQYGMPLAFAAYLASIAGACALLLRHAKLRDLVPMALLILIQALWFIVPAVVPALTHERLYVLPFTAVWVSTAHAIQYLWITSYYARQADPEQGLAGYFGKALLAGALVNSGPALLFAPSLLGTRPFDAGLGILLFSVVNLHHFMLDGAIWKLRDGPVARLLLVSAPERSSTAETTWRAPGRGLAVAGAIGALCLAISLVDTLGREVELAGDELDVASVARVSERLHWLGRESASMHVRAARMYRRRDMNEAALAQYRRSLEVEANAEIWNELAHLYVGRGEWGQAASAFGAALALDPGNQQTSQNLAVALANDQRRAARKSR
jgi:tetratricopeptide (TPR) repeat protein